MTLSKNTPVRYRLDFPILYCANECTLVFDGTMTPSELSSSDPVRHPLSQQSPSQFSTDGDRYPTSTLDDDVLTATLAKSTTAVSGPSSPDRACPNQTIRLADGVSVGVFPPLRVGELPQLDDLVSGEVVSHDQTDSSSIGPSLVGGSVNDIGAPCSSSTLIDLDCSFDIGTTFETVGHGTVSFNSSSGSTLVSYILILFTF